jgi:hypothetical protein
MYVMRMQTPLKGLERCKAENANTSGDSVFEIV